MFEKTPNSNRAQTGIDFIVAMSIFLVSIGFIFGFLPTIFEPFTDESGEHKVIADRSTAHIAENMLGSPDEPGRLNATCTVRFFDDGTTDGCRFDSTDLHEELGTDEWRSINVTVEDSSGIREIDGVTLSKGSNPDHAQNVVVSRRVVTIDGEHNKLYVRVW